MKHEISQLIKKERFLFKNRGFSLIEVVLATSVFALIMTSLAGVYLYGQESTATAGNRARAVFLAEEGLEAVRNIRDQQFTNIANGVYGLSVVNNIWTLSGSSDNNGIFNRTITISSVDSSRKSIVSRVTWQQTASRNGSVVLTTILSNWQKTAEAPLTCEDEAQNNGYSGGVCRKKISDCSDNGELYLLSGDQFCPSGPDRICCALP